MNLVSEVCACLEQLTHRKVGKCQSSLLIRLAAADRTGLRPHRNGSACRNGAAYTRISSPGKGRPASPSATGDRPRSSYPRKGVNGRRRARAPKARLYPGGDAIAVRTLQPYRRLPVSILTTQGWPTRRYCPQAFRGIVNIFNNLRAWLVLAPDHLPHTLANLCDDCRSIPHERPAKHGSTAREVDAGEREEPREWRQGPRLQARPGQGSTLLPGRTSSVVARDRAGAARSACGRTRRHQAVEKRRCLRATAPGPAGARVSCRPSCRPVAQPRCRGVSPQRALLLGLRSTAFPAVTTGLNAGGCLTPPLAAPGSRPAPT